MLKSEFLKWPADLHSEKFLRIFLLYFIFAAISTFVNIFAQDLFLRFQIYGQNMLLSVLFGTGAGLAVKYWLDKNYIFRFRAANAMHDARTFMLYSAMGVLTTLIFWTFEFGFQAFFQTKNMRYLGGVIGLSIGYFIKYQMDKRFVFRRIL